MTEMTEIILIKVFYFFVWVGVVTISFIVLFFLHLILIQCLPKKKNSERIICGVDPACKNGDKSCIVIMKGKEVVFMKTD